MTVSGITREKVDVTLSTGRKVFWFYIHPCTSPSHSGQTQVAAAGPGTWDSRRICLPLASKALCRWLCRASARTSRHLRVTLTGSESYSRAGSGEEVSPTPAGPCSLSAVAGAAGRSSAPARAHTGSPRSDVAAAAGRITLLALCWYPFETGLRRETLEVPVVVNVGSAHSRRCLSHEGGGERKHAAPPQTLRGGGVSASE